jgi:hypothetical protein
LEKCWKGNSLAAYPTALAANWSGEEETIEAKCLAHARRKFIEIERTFPGECGRVLDAIAQVYITFRL